MSSHIKSRKHPGGAHRFAMPAVAALSFSLPIAAVAQQSLPEVNVSAERESVKTDTSASPKITQPLVDTPKTIQIIPQELFREQGATTLTDALRAVPGITLQLGENGNTSSGDTFQMRGFSTQTSTFVDGIRDLGAVTRDIFNINQIEVVKGPSGSDIGRGASSGYINLISKLPTRENLSETLVTLGTGDEKRISADLNRKLGDSGAFRINVFAQDSGVDGRDYVNNKGIGIAPAFAFGLGTPTRLFFYSQHLRSDNVPDGGIPTIGMPGYFNGAANPANSGAKVNRENFYGSSNDYEKIDADMVTLKFEHDLWSGTTLRNISRYGKSHMDRVLTGVNALTATGDPSTWTVARSRQRVDQENDVIANQTILTTAFQAAGMRHDLSTGVELLYERQLSLGTGTTAQTIRGVPFAAISNPAANVYSPNAGDDLGVPYLTGADTEGKTTTLAAFVFDTLTINERWKLVGGLRFDRYSTTSNINTIVTTGAQGNIAQFPGYAAGAVAPTELEASDNLLSWNAGAVFKPAPNGSVYVAVANSYTPPGSANFTLSAAAGNQANSALDPQETFHQEVGTKWDVLDKRLSLTAALFRTENDKQTSFDDLGNAVQSGKTRVEGIELGVAGAIGNNWQVFGGITRMDAKQLDQQNATGVDTVAVRWTPKWAASLWTTYTMARFTAGGGVRYVGEQLRTITTDSFATQNMPAIPAYTVFDAMVGYRITNSVSLRLNLYNLLDEEYISTLNNGGSRMQLGAPRSASVTAAFTF